MAKYRILRHKYPDGKVLFETQKKVLGLFWLNYGNIDAYETGFYSTLEQAEAAGRKDREKPLVTVEKYL